MVMIPETFDPTLFTSLGSDAESKDWRFTLTRLLYKSSQLRMLHRARNDLYDKYARLYHKQHWLNPPLDEADYQMTLPIHTIVVNTSHSILTGMDPEVVCTPPASAGPRLQNQADQVEQWHLAVDRDNNFAAGEDIWAQAAFYQCQFSVGVLREVYNFPSNWSQIAGTPEEWPRHPVTQHALDPRQVYWEWGNPPRGRFRLVFYEAEMTVGDIQAVFNIEATPRLDEKGKILPVNYEETRTVVDWWEWIDGRIYHTIFMEIQRPRQGEQLGQFLTPPTPMPEYWTLPYHIFPFFTTGSRAPQEWAVGPLYALTDIPHWMEIIASRQMRSLELYVDPIIKAIRGPNSPDRPIEVNRSPGSIIDLVAGDDLQYLQWQGSGPDIDRLWGKLDEIIHELTFSKQLMSQGSADATGFRTALDRETSLLKISKGLQNYETARSQVYTARAYAMSRFSPDIPIQAGDVAILGSRISQFRNISVTVKPRFAGDLLRDINTAVQAVAGNIWSLDDAMEFVPPPNGGSKAATRDALIADKLEMHPLVLEARAQQIAAKIQAETQQAIPGGGAGGPGVPPLPGMQHPGPVGGVQGLPGTPSAPGQPGGLSGASPFTAGMDNRLKAPATGGATGPDGMPTGTVQPSSIIQQILAAQQNGGGG